MKIIVLVISLCISRLTFAQKIIIDSSIEDTTGFSRELSIIESKLGILNDSIKKNLICLEVEYRGFDEKGNADTTSIHKGVLVVHHSVREDLTFIFKELLERNFPVQKVIPINKYGLNADSSGWNDSKSMEDNNTSVFNYRLKTNSKELSPHALGLAIDINPLFNPYEKYEKDGRFTEPRNAFYNKMRNGTITDSIVTGLFDNRGWIWGGRWNNPIDYQHFELRKNRDKKHYLMKESNLKNWYRYDDILKIHYLFESDDKKKKNIPELKIKQNKVKEFEKLGKQNALEHSLITRDIRKKIVKYGKRQKSILLLADYSDNYHLNSNVVNLIDSQLVADGFQTDTCQQNSTKLRNYDLIIKISLAATEKGDSDSAYQVIFIPGAFKEPEMSNPLNRLRFFNLMIGEDLKKSERIATVLQNEIKETMGIKALDRQTNTLNFLEKDCIKTDKDGIYCGNMSMLNRFNCPAVFIQLRMVNINESEFFIQNDSMIQRFVRSVYKTIQDYCKNKS